MTSNQEAPAAVSTIISPRWIVPVEPAGTTLTDHSIAVDAGVIVAIGPTTEVTAAYRATETVDLPHHVLTPGLINVHTHAPMTLLRGYADDLPLMTWLEDYIWPAEGRWVGPEFVRDGTRIAIAEMLRSGTTCAADMYFHAEVTAAVAQEIGMRMVVGMICLDAPTNYASGPEEYLRKGVEIHRSLAELPLVTAAFAPHSPYALSDDAWRQIVGLADQLDVPIHTHLHETAAEVADSLRIHGVRPIERLASLGALNHRLVAAHMTQLLESDYSQLAAAGMTVAHCPESNLKLASGFCQVASLQAAGVNVAIGTDGAASNNDLDMLAELRLTAILAKGTSGDASAVPAHTALRMATLDGARCLQLDHLVGSIEVGKQADFAAFSLDGAASIPTYDPVSQLVYATTRDQVSDVWVAGNRQVHDGTLVGFDIDELRNNGESWARRIRG